MTVFWNFYWLFVSFILGLFWAIFELLWQIVMYIPNLLLWVLGIVVNFVLVIYGMIVSIVLKPLDSICVVAMYFGFPDMTNESIRSPLPCN